MTETYPYLIDLIQDNNIRVCGQLDLTGSPSKRTLDISRAIATAALRPGVNGCTLWISIGNFTEIMNSFCSYEGSCILDGKGE
jgi:hypothetical protein